MGDRKAPQIDRTSKPHISPRNQNGLGIGNENIKVSPLSWGNREERMTPIHGTVVSTYSDKIVRALSSKIADMNLHMNITAFALTTFVFVTNIRVLNDQKCLWCWILSLPFHIMLGISHVYDIELRVISA